MQKNHQEYYRPECMILEMMTEDCILIGSDLVGGGEDGEMEEGGEI